jgi:hypothetical protein
VQRFLKAGADACKWEPAAVAAGVVAVVVPDAAVVRQRLWRPVSTPARMQPYLPRPRLVVLQPRRQHLPLAPMLEAHRQRREPVRALAAVEAAAVLDREVVDREAVPRLQPVVRRAVEAFLLRGIRSLKKKRGVDLQDQALDSMQAERWLLQAIWCSQTSPIGCLRSRPTPVSRFWI